MSTMKRLRIQRDLCPLMSSDSDRAKLLPKFAELNTDIDRRCEAMRKLENEHFGCSAILGREAERNSVYVACVLLAFARLNDSLDSECHLISNIMQMVGTDPCDALVVRDAFRTQGALYEHVEISDASAIDHAHAQISEVALNKVLGRDSTPYEEYLHVKNIMEVVSERTKTRR